MRRNAFFFWSCGLLLVWAATGRADIVETRNGARLVGKIAKIDGGRVFLATDYAGDLEIKQEEVTALVTDEAGFVRLEDGAIVPGRVAPEDDGGVVIQGPEREVHAQPGEVAAFWPVDGEDPAVVSRREEDRRPVFRALVSEAE